MAVSKPPLKTTDKTTTRGRSTKYVESLEERRTRTESQRVFNLFKSYYSDHIWNKWIDGYKDYLLNTTDREQEILPFQENLKVPVTKMYVDALWKSIYDNSFNFSVTGRYKEYHSKAESAYNFLSWGFSASSSRKQLMQTIKEALILGNWYGKIGFVNQTNKTKFMKNMKWVETEDKEQYPFIKYVPAFNIFHDPSVDFMEDSLYVFERKIMHSKDIIKNYGAFCPDIDKKIKEAQESPYRYYSYDFNRIKYLAFFNQTRVASTTVNSTTYTNNNISGEFDIWFRNFATIDYDGGFSEVLEYWEDNKFVLMVDGRVIFDWDNPLPIKKKPYFEIHYNKIPGIPFGQGLSLTIGPIQKVVDKIFNMAIDNMKMQVAPMFQKLKGADIFSDGQSTLEYSPFKVWETNQTGAIQRLDLGVPDFSGINFVDFLMKLAEMSEGINSYSVGYQGKVERSATGVSALVQASKASLLPLIDSLNVALGKIAEIWMVTGVAVMDEEITVKVNDEKGKAEWKKIEMSDLLGKFDIEFDAQALKTATRETRRAQFMSLLDLAGRSGQDPSTGEFFIDMRKIWKELLDSFELDSTDIVMEEKQIIEKKTAAFKAEQKFQSKITPKQKGPTKGFEYPTPADEWIPQSIPHNIEQTIQPIDGESQVTEGFKTEGSSRNDILMEALQS